MNNKKKNIFIKDIKGENYILLFLSIVSIILGILILSGVLELNENILPLKENVFSIILIVCGAIGGFLSVYNLRKNKNKKPFLPIYQKLKEDISIEKINEKVSIYGYIAIEAMKYPYDEELAITIEKDGYDIFMAITPEKCVIGIDLSEARADKVSWNFYDDFDPHRQTIIFDNKTKFEKIINVSEELISSYGKYVDEHFEKMRVK